MHVHNEEQRRRTWRRVGLSLGIALLFLSNSLNNILFSFASPVPQAIFRADHTGQQQAANTGAATILDILGERPEFSKLLDLIQKDEDLMHLLGDADTQSTLFAPTNEAFDSVSDIDYPTRDVLMYHIADRAYNSSSLHDKHVIASLYESPGLDNVAQLLRISLEKPDIPSAENSVWMQDEPEIWIADSAIAENAAMTEGSSGLYINRAKVVIPDLVAHSGGVVHGVSHIIQPPGKTILDEIERHGLHFTCLNKAWVRTGVDAHIRDGKSMTLFAAHDEAWKALPKKLVKWLFSNKGRDHLKIFSMYQIANRVVYTPEIFNRTRKDGTPDEDYHEIVLQSLLHSPKYLLHVKGEVREKDTENDALSHRKIDYKSRGPTDLIEWGDPTPKKPDNKTGHHCLHHDPDHPHHHPHHGSKRHRHHHHHHHHKHPHDEDDKTDSHKPHHRHPVPRRDEIVVNEKAHVMHGYEDWIAGNGVIHVVDKVLIPPRSEGCEKMTAAECSAWETIWDLSNVGLLNTVVDDAAAWWEDLMLFNMTDA
ncbi:hypothetical protein EDD21DRAFT_411357 [Dissophora ornata]|nr:hypothetical protein BGZ58_002270 [Dissophora ornata]KAI8605206.1 hypothetical protein EDD21DRAFT_411357 [Dissophora ornata]